MIKYSKPAFTVVQQIQLLESRGVVVSDQVRATAFLNTCNFYRFGGFARYFLQNPNNRPQQYRLGTQFEDVVNLMHFDRALRLLMMDAIERLEVAIRSVITSQGSVFYSTPHWYLDPSNFKDPKKHTEFVSKSKDNFLQSHETFADHYKKKYNDPGLPPAWVIAEITMLGTWSHLFKNLASRSLRNDVARVFNLDHERLEKNLHVLTTTRNLSAHHSRVWNRVFTFTPSLKQYKVQIPVPSKNSFAAQAGMLWVMLKAIEPTSSWTQDLRNLLVKYGINPIDMGFPANWDTDSFWIT